MSWEPKQSPLREKAAQADLRGAHGAQVGDGNVQQNYFAPVTQVLPGPAVPLAVAAKDPGPVFAAADVDGFTGREWLIASIDAFIAANSCGYVLIEAEAGMGKTALAAWLAKTRGYPSHFSRYSDGRSAQTALRNLSAQVIRDTGLGLNGSDGMVPHWAQTPSGFESLLTAAAALASEQGRHLVVVADGLDEAHGTGDGLPFGLPMLLPPGVYVVGTYRTGHSPRRPETPFTTLRISRDDYRNMADILAYLERATREEPLADRLARAGQDASGFARTLAAASGGIWVYLRYVLEEFRGGLRRPDAVLDLPSGLLDYYADQFRRWQADPLWDRELRPLVALLGVAREPLTVTTLARLVGLEPGRVRHHCDRTFRALLSTTPGAIPGTRYEIYHASLRDLLRTGNDYLPAGDPAGRAYSLVALADELRDAALAAHDSVASSYLGIFGGLEAGLPVLAADPGAAGIDDSYPLRHLAHHLEHAGRAAELARLLATESATRDKHAVNTWYSAHEHAGTLHGYMEDLARARDISAAETSAAFASFRPAGPSLGAEIRYALMAASIISRTSGIPTPLLKRLISSGHWTAARGLDHARRLTDPAARARALAAIQDHTPPEQRGKVAAEAWEAWTCIADEASRAGSMAALAPCLSAELLPSAIAAACDITDVHHRALALASLGPRLPAELLPGALAAATAVAGEMNVLGPLTSLIPHLPADLLNQVLDVAAALRYDQSRARLLSSLRSLPSGLVDRALAIAYSMSEDQYRAEALTSLAAGLAADRQEDAVAQALAAAMAIPDRYWRVEALSRLAPSLDADQRENVAGRARDAALAIPDQLHRGHALASLISWAPASQCPAVFARAREAAARVRSTDDLWLYVRLAVLGPAGQRGEALARALSSAAARADGLELADFLAGVAPELPSSLLGQALDTASRISDPGWRADAVAGLSPCLPAGLLDAALVAVTDVTDEGSRSWALASIAPFLSPGEREDAAARALSALAPISHFGSVTYALASLAPHLPDRLLAAALDKVTAMPAFDRHIALRALSPRLARESLVQLLASLSADYPGVRSLASIAPALPAEALAPALAKATAMPDEMLRAEAIAALAPHLPAGLQGTDMEAVGALSGSPERARALTALASYLPSGLLEQALDAGFGIEDCASRIRAIASLAPRLPAGQRESVLAAALGTMTGEGSRWDGCWHALAPLLPPGLLAEAARTAAAIASDRDRAETLAGLAPHLPPDQRELAIREALLAAARLTGTDYIFAIAALAPSMTAPQREDAMTHALPMAIAGRDGEARALNLAVLAPHLPAVLHGQALDAATSIEHNGHRAYALASLAPCLPPGQQQDALARSLACVADDSVEAEHRDLVLPELIPQLPAGLLLEAVNTIGKEDEAFSALVARGRDVSHDENSFQGMLRDSFNAQDRATCLRVIAVFSPAMAGTGGPSAIREVFRAIEDVYRWWP